MKERILLSKPSWVKRSLTLLLCVVTVLALSPGLGMSTANAETAITKTAGAFTVTAETQADLDAVTYESGTLTFGTGTAGKSYTVRQTAGTENATSDQIVVKDGTAENPTNITLDGVNINVSGTDNITPLRIENSYAANLVLADGSNNTLSAGCYCAGLSVPEGASVTISGNSGKLAATGGFSNTGEGSGAGIGGNKSESGGTITINGGIITATAKYHAAGIGGGSNSGGGTITIRGGTVTASGHWAAGIGGSSWTVFGGTTNISGGIIVANGGEYGAGIGGGWMAHGGTTNISGGIITAIGAQYGAGIGSGYKGFVGTININGGTVTANGGEQAAGIGGGADASGGTTDISGGTITANGGFHAAGIGGGAGQSGGTISISKGTVTANSGDYATGIGGGFVDIGATLKIGNEANVIATSNEKQCAIITDGDIEQIGDGTAAGIIQVNFENAPATETEVEVLDGHCKSFSTPLTYKATIYNRKSIAFISPSITSETNYTLFATPKDGTGKFQQHDTEESVKFVTGAGNAFNNYNSVKPTDKWPLVVGDDIVAFDESATVTYTLADSEIPEGKVFDKWTVASGDITLADAASTTASFTMPASVVELAPTLKEKAAPTPTPSKPTVKPVQMLNTYVSAGSSQIKLNWSKIKDADGYYIYGSRCGKTMKKLKTVKGNTWTQKKLVKGGTYKYQIKAYKKTTGGTKVIKSSLQIHVATLASKKTNATKINTNFTSAVLKKGATKQIYSTTIKRNPKEKLVNHTDKYRYRTNCSKIATVSKNGKIKAVGKGTCNIYVYANNGVYKKLTIHVK